MSGSPIEQLLAAFDSRNVDSVVSLLAPDTSLLTADGQRAEGLAAVREVVETFLSSLRSTSHEIVSQWHVEDVWIAELQASYELRDWLQINALPRACFVRAGPDGISELHMYGAHEHPLTEGSRGEGPQMVGGHIMLPL